VDPTIFSRKWQPRGNPPEHLQHREPPALRHSLPPSLLGARHLQPPLLSAPGRWGKPRSAPAVQWGSRGSAERARPVDLGKTALRSCRASLARHGASERVQPRAPARRAVSRGAALARPGTTRWPVPCQRMRGHGPAMAGRPSQDIRRRAPRAVRWCSPRHRQGAPDERNRRMPSSKTLRLPIRRRRLRPCQWRAH